MSFVTRPDLTPPGVSIAKAANYDGLVGHNPPNYIFLGLRTAASVTPPAGSTPGLTILDTDGNLVWFQPETSKSTDPFNFGVQFYKGQPVLAAFLGTVGPGYGVAGNHVIFDSTYKQIASVNTVGYAPDLHEFTITSENTALMTAYHAQGSVVVGHAQEVDIASGDLVFDWPCYPQVAVAESYSSPGTTDYFHINSIDVFPDSTRDLLVSGRNTCTLYRIDRATKSVKWRLHGKKNNFKLGPGADFWYQHDARVLPDGSGISVFDDASKPGPEKNAWGKVIALNQTSMTATMRHEFEHTTYPLQAGSLGSFRLLPWTGGHFVGWGNMPWFSEFAPPGLAVGAPLILDGRFQPSVETYRAFMGNWTGNPPLSELTLVVLAGAGSGNFVGFVSWNGATEVASWVMKAGTSSTSLSTVAMVPKTGFETSIAFTMTGATDFQVQALNSTGSSIGTSSVVTLTTPS